MRIEVCFFAMFRDAIGQKSIEREYDSSTTVYDVLRDIEELYPGLRSQLIDDGGIPPTVTVLRNGQNIVHFQGAETLLADGDTVTVAPPVTGG